MLFNGALASAGHEQDTNGFDWWAGGMLSIYLVNYWELMYPCRIAPHIGRSGEVMDTFPYHMKVWLFRTKYLQI
jgi:hypothetical protein